MSQLLTKDIDVFSGLLKKSNSVGSPSLQTSTSLGFPPLAHEKHEKHVRSYDRLTHKRCIKCRQVKPREQFGDHDDNDDGKQSYCYECKNKLGKRRRNVNVRARLRHHFATRIASQLQGLCPKDITQNLEHYLGYTLRDLAHGLTTRLKEDYPSQNLKLRDVLNEGWHVDHIYPLSRFNVVTTGNPTSVDWVQLRACWTIDNLRAIPAEDNLKKGSRVTENPTRVDGVPF